MAQKHSFEKQKIHKHHPQDYNVESSFASLSLRHDDDDIASTLLDSHREGGKTSTPLFEYNSAYNSSDRDLSERLRNGGHDWDAPRSSEETTLPSVTSDSSTASLRKTSISFARDIKTSDGGTKRLEEPLPRSAPRSIPWPAANGACSNDIQQDDEDVQYRPSSKARHERAEQAYAQDNEELAFEQPSRPRGNSMTTKALVASEGIVSPVSDRCMTSVSAVLSPSASQRSLPDAEIRASPWPRRSDSRRSRSYQQLDTMGGRRRSGRSATSSISPASAFLSKWSRSNVTQEAEADDEGQEISDSGWIIGRTIGYGGFSSVKEVSTIDGRTGKKVVRAVKIVRKQPRGIRDEEQNDNVQADFGREVSLWRYFRNRYIVPLIAVYESDFATFCITKLNVGGTLHDLVRSRRQQYKENDRGLSAPFAKRYTYQIAAALRYLHEDVRVVHRDIKLENCLLDMTAPDAASTGGNILLCDFGMADYIYNESRDDHVPNHGAHNIGPGVSSSQLNYGNATLADLGNRDTTLTIMGSLEYAAPEVITATDTLFSLKADIWAFGVCVYALLTGSLPFSHSMQEKLVLMIEKSQWDITPLYTAPAVRGQGLAGTAAIDLVKGCLTYNGDERWSVAQVLNARWLLNCDALYGDGALSDEEMEEWRR